MGTVRRRLQFAAVAAVATLTAGVLTACSSGTSANTVTLSLVAYSTPQAAYAEDHQGVPEDHAAGKNVKFTQSYGASGDQSRAVAAGQKADIVAFSLAPDIDPSGDREARRRGLELQPVQGHGHRLGRRDRHP